MKTSAAVVAVLSLLPVTDRARADEAPGLPKVVLVGDSIRLGYQPTVTRELAGRAVVVGPRANGGDSTNVLRNVEAWVVREKPDVVHLNCGIHDTKRFRKTGVFQVSPDAYEKNLRDVIAIVREKTDAVVLLATSTPIVDERAAEARRERDYELLDASIDQYNAIVRKVAKELKIPVDDLNAVLSKEAETLIGKDGVHPTRAGYEKLGHRVATFVGERLPEPAGTEKGGTSFR